MISYNTAGKTAFDRSKTYDFLYVDHQEYAEVGVQHIVPFINTLAEYVSAKAETAVNPDKVESQNSLQAEKTRRQVLKKIFLTATSLQVQFTKRRIHCRKMIISV